ncbi:beta-galactosidase GalB [Mucilaginibacter sp. SJ]|uniref:beta-galactosidase GalB n=1 Tax=Mucilaginibacter sp. SJ TaxID=3029053 RepID=UPI0023A99726|nr:beta-galactosidase GalB [Mucilaginibacter sp. SJ]WEA00600.1 beta-galactosidase GalB [Mucilaginibacter sp. SJ]
MKYKYLLLCILLLSAAVIRGQGVSPRQVSAFDKNWLFNLGDVTDGQRADFDDAEWRRLDLPHDWSIEGKFSKDNPSKPEGGALPGGIGWYRKTFKIPASGKGKLMYIDFDGVYQKSDVWLNGHHLGFRPNGYISFRYELTPYLKYGNQKNVIAVRVDNSAQPNSRWYSGSGIYRHVRLLTVGKIAVDQWGTFVTCGEVIGSKAYIKIQTSVRNRMRKPHEIELITSIYDQNGKRVSSNALRHLVLNDTLKTFKQQLTVVNPNLWSVDKPTLYKVITKIVSDKIVVDNYSTTTGIRNFSFDADKGFTLNGKSLKILGVCNHHDLGCLGAAMNVHALRRQLEMLKAMGCNAIRTSHNPPAPELLELADSMGFIVMDETFDCWEKAKEKYDYHLFFKKWHKRDLQDQVLRDRNHPSVMIWSIGNEIPEQSDSSGFRIAKDLAEIVHKLDNTRPITAANNHPDTKNQIISSGATDLIGYNYHHNDLVGFHERYPNKKFVGTETTSALETRGIFDMPSDSIRRWSDEDKQPMNTDLTVSSYDNVSTPWGSTHEETWKIIKKHDFLSGMFIWTGFDYLGEPTPYTWPARSSYFGIIDLAGFPKDVYYMYQSEWTNKPVLHLLPHWNWEAGKTVDVWAYYNNADEVELYLNGKSLGIKRKSGDDLHVMWHVKYEPGTLRAVSRKTGVEVLSTEVKTVGPPAKLKLITDKKVLNHGDEDLAFITVKVVDKDGNLVPFAKNKISFTITGDAFIAGVDNGDPVSHEPFKADYRYAYNGLALVVIQARQNRGRVTISANADGLQKSEIKLEVK